ncbi:FecR domain-containing protein [Candidatus Poribacteria bacterium]|nr:FecR domain-containing protein [Candidatus Poribacteria bacterium]
MKRSSLCAVLLWLAMLLAALPSALLADAVVTLAGKRVEGEIVYENESEIRLKTKEYGELRFRKRELKTVVRGRGTVDPAAAQPAPGQPNPFGDGAAPAAPNPFGGPSTDANPFAAAVPAQAAPNPFGEAAAPGAPAATPPSTSPNPFGVAADNPFAPAGVPADSGSGIQNVSAEIPRFRRIEEPALPEVPFGWDGVLFGIPEGGSVQVKQQSSDDSFTAAEADTNLRAGGEVLTSEHKARVVLRGGKDIVRLPERTHIQLVELQDNSVTIELKRGAIWSEVAPRTGGGHFVVRTPNVTAGVTGTVFRMSDGLDQGVSVAVLDGSVLVESLNAQIKTPVPSNFMVTVLPDGTHSPLMPLSERIRQEYEGWGNWAAESIASLGGAGMGLGGAAAAAIIEDTAAQNAQWSSEMATGNYYVSINKLGAYLKSVGDGFRGFAEDTSHVPTTEEGFTVLRNNSGNWEGWKGPYWDGSLPPLDSWGRPLRYRMKVSETSGNIFGVVYSLGEDNVDNQGSASGDITDMVLYYQLDSISNNPDYAPEKLLQDMKAAAAEPRRQ